MSSSDDDPSPQPSNTTSLALVSYDPASLDHLLVRLKANLKQDGIHLRHKRFLGLLTAITIGLSGATAIIRRIKTKKAKAKIAKENAEMKAKLQQSQKDLEQMRGKMDKMKGELEEAKRQAEANKALIEKNNEELKGNLNLINENNQELKRNAEALSAFHHTLENQYSASTAELKVITQQLGAVLVSMEEARVEIDANIRSIQETIVSEIEKSEIAPIISHLKNFFAYFIDEMKRISKLPVRVRVAKLEDPHDVMGILKESRLPGTDSLLTLLSDIINRNFAIPKNAKDQMAQVLLDMLVYGTQVFAMIEVFLLQQYQFLAQVYLRQVDLVSYNRNILAMMYTWHSFTETLLDRGGLFEKVIEVLKRIGKEDVVKHQMVELMEVSMETIDDLNKVKVALIEMGEFMKITAQPVFSPELTFHDDRRGFVKIPKEKTRSSGWSTAKKVSYAMQFYDAKSGLGSMVSEWAEMDMAYEQFANPVVSAIPLDQHGSRFRLIYRKFDNGPAQLVANLTDHSATSFRDLDRDLYNAVLEPNEKIGLAELEVYLHRGNVNASFEYNKGALHVALENGNFKVFNKLLNSRARLDIQDVDGQSPLFLATQSNAVGIVKAMIKLGANPNIKAGPAALEVTPLHSAIVKDYPELTDYLIRSPRVDLNAPAQNGLSPLHYAASLDRVDVVKQLLAQGNRTAINARSKQNYTALHMAAISNSAEVAQMLLETKRMDINAPAKDGVTPLHLAGLYGANDTAVVLLEFGANVAARTRNGSIPLHYAADHGDLQIVSLLAEESREFINAINDREMSPLYMAMQRNQTEAVDIVLQNCAMLDLRLSYNKTMLHVAAKNGGTVAAINLIQAGLDVNSVDSRSNTALHYAVLNKNFEIAKVLLTKGANVNARNEKGQTPLHLTAFLDDEQSALKMAQLLVSYQADVNAKIDITSSLAPVSKRNHYRPRLGQSTLHLTSKLGYYMMTKLLIGAGANVNATDNRGHTALHLAAQSGHSSIVKLLLDSSVAVDHKNKYSETALHIASAEGHLETAKLLVDVGKANIYAKTALKQTPLAYAVNGRGTFEMYKWFVVEKKVNAGVKDKMQLSLLHYAARTGKREIISDLIHKRDIFDYLAMKNQASYCAHIPKTGNYLAHYAAYLASVELLNFVLSFYRHEKQFKEANKAGEWPLASYLSGNGSLETFDRYFFNSEYGNSVLKQHKADRVDYSNFRPPNIVPYAAFKNRTEFVPFLIGKGMNFKTETWKGLKAIHYAAKNGNREMVKVLVEKGVDVNDVDGEQKGPLFHAIEGRGDLELVKFLINKNANFEYVKDKKGFTLADVAIRVNKTEIVRYLHFDKSVNFKDVDDEGQTPLHVTAFWDNLPMVKYFLEKKGFKVDEKDGKGQTALYKAIDGHGQMELVRFLVEQHKASLATLDAKTANSYVYQALLRDKIDIAKWLVKKRADIDSIGLVGETPLHLAVKKENIDMIRFLLANDALSLAKDSRGMTPVGLAILKKKEAVLHFIVSEYRRNDGQTALHEAAGKGDLELVRFLLQRGVSINAIDRENQTAVHVAAGNENAEAVVKLLVEQKCIDLEVSNSLNKTAKDVASFNGFSRMLDIFDKGTKGLSRKSRSVPFGTSASFSLIGSQVDVNGTMLLADLIARKVTGEKYFCTDSDSVVSQSDVRSFALNLSEAFEAMLRTVSAKFKLSYPGFDSFKLFQTLQSAACSGQWAAVERTLIEVGRGALGIEKGGEAGRYLAVQIDRLLVEVPVKGGRRRAK